ncbi:MAG TPA: hypothetical protein VFS00_34065, partial [Polyangiaceae bacterium]|nr:hypothetical protein [Polyangiaceae bacterium]
MSGWLLAGASCAEPSAETGDAGESEPAADTTRLAAQAPPGVPTQQPQYPQLPPFPSFTPNLDSPTAACSALLPNSTFQGYLVERVPGASTSATMCPSISSSLGTWTGTDIDLSPSYADMYIKQDSFFVGPKSASTCLYFPPAPSFLTLLTTPAQRYEALLSALGYPNQVSRDMLGLVCLPQASPAAAEPSFSVSGIPMCRKCAVAHENAITL